MVNLPKDGPSCRRPGLDSCAAAYSAASRRGHVASLAGGIPRTDPQRRRANRLVGQYRQSPGQKRMGRFLPDSAANLAFCIFIFGSFQWRAEERTAGGRDHDPRNGVIVSKHILKGWETPGLIAVGLIDKAKIASQDLRHLGQQLVRQKWFLQKGNRSQTLSGGQHGQRGGFPTHGYDADRWIFFAKLNDGFQTLLNRHVKVCDDQIGWLSAIMLHALLAVRSEDDFMASRSERVLKQRSHVRVVIYDKNPSHMSPSPEHGLYPKDFKLFLA